MSKAERTRQYIIEKAAPIFNTKGVAATSIADITEAAEMVKGSVYVHFENKEELTHQVVDWNLRMFVDRCGTEADRFKTAKDKFFGLLDYLSDPLNPPVQGGCPMLNFGMEADDTSPVIREKVHKTICTVQQSIIDIIEAGIADGEIAADWNYRDFAIKAYAMVEGGILVARVSQDISQMKLLVEMLKKELSEHFIAIPSVE